MITVKNLSVLADPCIVADSLYSRMKGLLGKTSLGSEEALLLKPCNSIHMWFMKFPIDVLFLKQTQDASHYKIVSFYADLPPWKLLPVQDFKASATLELPAGSIVKQDLKIGDELCLS